MLIPSQQVFALSLLCCVLSGEATNINLIVFDLTRSGLEPTIYRRARLEWDYRTQDEHANHYNTDAV